MIKHQCVHVFIKHAINNLVNYRFLEKVDLLHNNLANTF